MSCVAYTANPREPSVLRKRRRFLVDGYNFAEPLREVLNLKNPLG